VTWAACLTGAAKRVSEVRVSAVIGTHEQIQRSLFQNPQSHALGPFFQKAIGKGFLEYEMFELNNAYALS